MEAAQSAEKEYEIHFYYYYFLDTEILLIKNCTLLAFI